MATIGMMDSAFFVGRQEILTWINQFLQLNYQKIEETANGAAPCQIIDALHPGTVALERVDYNASREFEYFQNYQILQDAFRKVGIEKTIPVNDLCRGKYRDNLEWMQWLKRYFGMHWSDEAKYDARARRKQGAVLGARVAAARLPASSSMAAALATPQRASSAGSRTGVLSGRPSSVTSRVQSTPAQAPAPFLPATRSLPNSATNSGNASPAGPESAVKTSVQESALVSPPAQVHQVSVQDIRTPIIPKEVSQAIMRDNTNAIQDSTAKLETKLDAAQKEIQQATSQLADYRSQNAQLRVLIDTLEKERDFYFGKLRSIELWCDQATGPASSRTSLIEQQATHRCIQQVQAILYKPDS